MTKYSLKNDEHYMELDPTHTIDRMTDGILAAEILQPNSLNREDIHEQLDGFKKFIFGGSIQFGLGNIYQVSSLGNCFFINNGADSYGGIFNTDEQMVQLMKRRGGVGITIEGLRPEGSKVNNSARTSTGAVSFMNRFSESTREVAQDGRRGALMISMDINHPNSPQFLMVKDNTKKITGANISIKFTDEFMKAAKNNEEYNLHWPVQKTPPPFVDQQPLNKLLKDGKTYTKKIMAKDLWKQFIKQAHKNAEPGALFWDTVIRESPADCYADKGFNSLGVNPCGEVILSSHDSCRLASINLAEFVLNPYTKEAKLDREGLIKTARFAQRAMDDIVTLEEGKIKTIIQKIHDDPEDIEYKQVELNLWNKVLRVLQNGRRTGIGELGLGDMLAKLGLRYGTPEATDFTEEVFKLIAASCYKETVQLAKERGCFPIWNLEAEKNNPFIKRILENFNPQELHDYVTFGRRNIGLLSIAPTGSLSIEAGVTSGVEPVFKIYYRRRKKINPNDKNTRIDFVDEVGDSWEEYNVIHPEFVNWCVITTPKFTFNGAKTFLSKLSPTEFDKLIESSPWAHSESHDIDYHEKIKMQGRIQKWVDHAISITHNLPETATLEEVDNIYYEAWQAGCKGCTIYREGSRSGVLISDTKKEEKTEFVEHSAPKRPKVLIADYYIAISQGKKYAVIVGLLENKPYEIFAFENPTILDNCKGKIIKMGKGCYKFESSCGNIDNLQLSVDNITARAHTIFLSMLLRHGVGLKYIIEVSKKVDETISSFSSVCRRMLSKYVAVENSADKCPKCGGTLVREEGCEHCVECEYSRCSS
jgi:ribonucleoside-diphosphate reductase alpha chain